MTEPEKLIPTHGGYRHLKSFQVAQLAYDVTVRFADRYIEKRSRTHDQMVQAARSGVQNIADGARSAEMVSAGRRWPGAKRRVAEGGRPLGDFSHNGSKASGTSKKMELKLTNVARASLEELRLDYEDFLRHRALPLWPKEDSRRAELIARRCATADAVAEWVREVHDSAKPHGQNGPHGPNAGRSRRAASIPSTPSIQIKSPTYPEIAANAVLTLIAVACSLLDRQIAAQAAAFETEGGFTERLYRLRSSRRQH